MQVAIRLHFCPQCPSIENLFYFNLVEKAVPHLLQSSAQKKYNNNNNNNNNKIKVQNTELFKPKLVWENPFIQLISLSTSI